MKQHASTILLVLSLLDRAMTCLPFMEFLLKLRSQLLFLLE